MMPVNNYEYPESKTAWSRKTQAYAEIIEQPSRTALRFRYECERRNAGSIVGENTTFQRKTYPTIQVFGYTGPAAIVISCVTKDDPPKPHPHGITGRHTNNNGIYSIKVNIQEGLVSFSNLGIQCVKKKEVKDALLARKQENVDPFKTGFDHMNNPDMIDFNCVRLCFQIFLQGADHKYNIALKPLVSNPIFDKKTLEELLICKLSVCSAPVSGGTEVILLCGKVNKDDIEVRFFELRHDWLFWEGFGIFQPMHVHKQVAIVFRTPPYCDLDINEPVMVQIQIRKKSSGASSKPLPFLMLPMDVGDMNSLKRKRAKFDNDPRSYMLRQMQAQAEKQAAGLNQALLLNHPKPLQFPDHSIRENNNYIPERMNYNVQQENRENYSPTPPPRLSVNSLPGNYPQGRTACRLESPAQARVVNRRGSSFLTNQTHPEFPTPLPRRRIESPAPNVTVLSRDYRDYSNQMMDVSRHGKFPGNEEAVVNAQDPFPLTDLNNFDLPELKELDDVIDDHNDDDSLSDNISKTLSISGEIQDTFQFIRDLNNDVQQNEQQVQGKFLSHKMQEQNQQHVQGKFLSQKVQQQNQQQVQGKFLSHKVQQQNQQQVQGKFLSHKMQEQDAGSLRSNVKQNFANQEGQCNLYN